MTLLPLPPREVHLARLLRLRPGHGLGLGLGLGQATTRADAMRRSRGVGHRCLCQNRTWLRHQRRRYGVVVIELEKMAGSWEMLLRRPHRRGRLLLLLLLPFHCRGEHHRLPNLRPSHYRRLLLVGELRSRDLWLHRAIR